MALVCTGCATVQPVQQTIVSPPVLPSAWARNAKITAIAVPQTDESHLLDLSMWRFDIAAPKPAHEIKMIVEAQENGKPPREIVSLTVAPQIGWPMNKHLEVFVGEDLLYNGQGMGSKATYQIRTSSFYSAPLQQLGNNSASAVADNPLNGLMMTESGASQRGSDGGFVLASGSKAASSGPNVPPDVVLVFRVQEETY